MIEDDIVHENGNFWVSREGPGHFKVWEVRGVASYHCGTFHFRMDPAKARSRAIEECDKRAHQRPAGNPTGSKVFR